MTKFLFITDQAMETLQKMAKFLEDRGIKQNIDHKRGTIKTDNLYLMSTAVTSTIFGLIPRPDYVCVSSRTRPLSDNEILKLEEIRMRYKENTKEVSESEMLDLIEKISKRRINQNGNTSIPISNQ